MKKSNDEIIECNKMIRKHVEYKNKSINLNYLQAVNSNFSKEKIKAVVSAIVIESNGNNNPEQLFTKTKKLLIDNKSLHLDKVIKSK